MMSTKGRARAPVDLEIMVSEVGVRGDGVAETALGRVFVPLTVVGDRVRVRLEPPQGEGRRGHVLTWLERGPDAATPICGHFGRCGGCTLQHMTDATYADWKRARVEAALSRAGFPPVDSLRLERTPPGGRRRVSFTVTRRGKAVQVGFSERLSHRIVDLSECPVLAPRLAALLSVSRRSLPAILPQDGSLTVTASAPGSEVAFAPGSEVAFAPAGDIDLLLTGPARLDLSARQVLAEFAEDADIARLSWQPDSGSLPEPVAARRPVRVEFGGVAVEPPPGAFLQASAAGEAVLIGTVLAAAQERAGAGPVADLFAGCGTFSLPLAAQAGRQVYAVDGNLAAIKALTHAARRFPGVTAERRDLVLQPVSAAELARFAMVVFDPPRSGAAAQAEQLAASTVPVVVAVSCNPATFARDARILREGGFRLCSVLAVDQFLWSAHVELVAVFQR
ncbi:MAG: class I SAM-dependent RNA methyltransferase [Rhodospirillaceae bacterium]